MSVSLFAIARRDYHAALLRTGVLSLQSDQVASNADGSSAASVAIARGILQRIQSETSTGAARLAGQAAGREFERITKAFLGQTFLKLSALRPGIWDMNPQKSAIARFSQYRHLADLERISAAQPEIAAVLGRDYMIAPDIVITRLPETDEIINSPAVLVDETVAMMADLRKREGSLPIFHASISCKWTLRSDRAQNARSEALNLIRNRKGRLPHVVVVTGEPLPSRLASLALGTGDIDCVYHFALAELTSSVDALEMGDTAELVHMMIEGRRLKDISDLPLDLAV
jgi:hypothetical protein